MKHFLFFLAIVISCTLQAQEAYVFRDGKIYPADSLIGPCSRQLDSNLVGLINPGKYCDCLYRQLAALYSADSLEKVSKSTRIEYTAINQFVFGNARTRNLGQICLSNSALQPGFGLDLEKAISYLASNIYYELQRDPGYADFIKIYDPMVYSNCMAAELMSQIGLQVLFGGATPPEELASAIAERCLKSSLRKK